LGIGAGLSRAVAAVTTVIGLAVGGVASPRHADAPFRHQAEATATGVASIDLYRGLGSWVDIYERRSWADPERTIAGMHRHGVRTLYLQTTNFARKLAIKFPKQQARFIEAAHRAGMRIVAWYLPGFRHLRKDFHRSMDAISFRTPSGDRFDSFALDIESPEVRKPGVRTARLLRLSGWIRDAVGPAYPLGAIIPTPLGMKRNPTYWPRFPYRRLAAVDDVFLPMTYFTWATGGEQGAHGYTAACIRIIRNEVRDPSFPIHVIGGISNQSTRAEARGFVHAVREQGVIGASYYAYHGTSRSQWRALRRIPSNPVETPALPVSIAYRGALGDLPVGDRTHPRDVVFNAGRLRGSRILTYQAFDAQPGEVVLSVNWHPVARLPATPGDAWGSPRTVRLPARLFHRGGGNVVSFSREGGGAWAVRTLGLARPPQGEPSGRRHNR
jgi:hypothetical protein